ncbi:MAG: phage terminase small subunit P27 family [Hyphomicrobiaceae bacterium]
MRGRKPVPTALKVLRGNPGRRPIKANEPRPKGSAGDPPDWMTESQRAVWRATIAAAPPRMLTALDRGLLTIWVVACDEHRRAAIKVAELGPLARKGDGAPTQSPFLRIMNQQAGVMIKAASELGFSPAARVRLATGAATADDDEEKKHETEEPLDWEVRLH